LPDTTSNTKGSCVSDAYNIEGGTKVSKRMLSWHTKMANHRK